MMKYKVDLSILSDKYITTGEQDVDYYPTLPILFCLLYYYHKTWSPLLLFPSQCLLLVLGKIIWLFYC